MSHEARVTLHFDSAEEASRLAASLAPDEDGHLAIRVEGAALTLATASGTPMGLLRTLDEALAALAAARKAGRLASEG